MAESLYAHFLETRAGGHILSRPPKGAARKCLGAPRAGSADQYTAALRQDDLSVHVCGGHVVCGADGGN